MIKTMITIVDERLWKELRKFAIDEEITVNQALENVLKERFEEDEKTL